MDLKRLYEILAETTVQLRKGDVIEGTPALVNAIKAGDDNPPGGIAEIYLMPHVAEARPDLEKIDMEFMVIGVDKVKAEQRRAEFTAIIDQYPKPDRLASGPSYIEVGGEIGDQGAAFQLFALGKALGLWDVITPATFGMVGQQAMEAAGNGFVMITGYRAKAAAS